MREGDLRHGLAFDRTARVLYASGGGGNRLYAFDVAASGALAANPGRTIDLGLRETSGEGRDPSGALQSAYVSGLALSRDGTVLFAALQRGQSLAMFSTMTGQMIHRV